MAHDVFISYASKDKPNADAVCALLEARGIRCWIAPRDIQPGKVWSGAIVEAIEGSRAMVVVFTSNVNESDHVPKEVECAFERGVTVIPLRIEAVRPAKSLDYFLSNVHWLDALTPPLEQHVDQLAATISKILPRPPIPPPIPSPRPVPPPPPPVPPSRGTNWLPIAGVGVLVLAGVLWFSLRNTGPGPANPVVPANPNGPVSPASAPNPAPGPSVGKSSDPIVGCWQWFNNAAVTIRDDGTMTAGPFTARWRRVDARIGKYTFTWPEAVDKIVLSGDASTLNGGNQYGYTMSATRIGPGPGIAGTWHWYNNAIVLIGTDGSVTAGPILGRWRSAGGNNYEITWPKPVDTVTLATDRDSLRGANQFGIAISGQRNANCGN